MTQFPAKKESPSDRVGLLLSGGLDSAILLGELLGEGSRVTPFYIRTGVRWEAAELSHLTRLLAAMAGPRLEPLVEFQVPLDDVYGPHWSVAGGDFPTFDSPDEAMFLPGRNALLLVKPVVYCQLHGLERLALAPLTTSPFADAKPSYFERLLEVLNEGAECPVRAEVPFTRLTKREVMQLGRRYPLQFTFSCIAPVGDRHCGVCNKCAERQAAFAAVGLADPTAYAQAVRSAPARLS